MRCVPARSVSGDRGWDHRVVTSSTPPDGAPLRRSRRAVRHAGTVGGDDANLVSTHPALGTPPDGGSDHANRDDIRPGDERRDPRATRLGVGTPTADPTSPAREPAVSTRSVDDSDVGWGDRETGTNDDRLHQDKPPHW